VSKLATSYANVQARHITTVDFRDTKFSAKHLATSSFKALEQLFPVAAAARQSKNKKFPSQLTHFAAWALGKPLAKDLGRSDWELAVLSPAQKKYATLDVTAPLKVVEKFATEGFTASVKGPSGKELRLYSAMFKCLSTGLQASSGSTVLTPDMQARDGPGDALIGRRLEIPGTVFRQKGVCYLGVVVGRATATPRKGTPQGGGYTVMSDKLAS
jgi:hypothetical protein